jgi:uncharacterized protein
MSPHRTAEGWIGALDLRPHPEGGWFREIYRSDERLERAALPARYAGARAMSTSIYFLLKSGDVSRFHRLKSDEIWHFYEGSPIVVHILNPDGACDAVRLGRGGAAGEVFQAVVRAGFWFGAEVVETRSFGLVGCTIAPGFDFDDFELARRGDLMAAFPGHAGLITRLTLP